MFNLVGECPEGGDASNPLSVKCSGYKLDFRKIYDMQDASGTTRTTDFGAIGWSGNFNRDADGYSRHPYMFSSDEFADGGNVSVYRHDAGADLYEQAQYFINSYENRYVWDNFRRNRVMFNVGGTVNRTLARYFDKMTATTKAMGLILDGGPGDGQYLGHEELLLTHALASSMGFEEFIKVLTRPEPGAYRFARSRDLTDTCTNKSYAEVAEYYADDLCNPNERETTPPAFTLKVGQGVRYMHNEYDYSKGYEWSDYLRWVGSYYEKVHITYFLTEAYNNFLQNSRDDYVDGRDRNINYARIYPEQMRRLTASMMQNDFTLYAPYVLPQTSGFNTSADPVQWLRSTASRRATPAPFRRPTRRAPSASTRWSVGSSSSRRSSSTTCTGRPPSTWTGTTSSAFGTPTATVRSLSRSPSRSATRTPSRASSTRPARTARRPLRAARSSVRPARVCSSTRTTSPPRPS
jgi:hypothetical protein